MIVTSFANPLIFSGLESPTTAVGFTRRLLVERCHLFVSQGLWAYFFLSIYCSSTVYRQVAPWHWNLWGAFHLGLIPPNSLATSRASQTSPRSQKEIYGIISTQAWKLGPDQNPCKYKIWINKQYLVPSFLFALFVDSQILQWQAATLRKIKSWLNLP